MEWFVTFAQQTWAPYVVIILVAIIVIIVRTITEHTKKK